MMLKNRPPSAHGLSALLAGCLPDMAYVGGLIVSERNIA